MLNHKRIVCIKTITSIMNIRIFYVLFRHDILFGIAHIYRNTNDISKILNKINDSALPDDLKHYIDPNDFNRVIYHQRSTDADERMKQLLTDADKLLASDLNPAMHQIHPEIQSPALRFPILP